MSCICEGTDLGEAFQSVAFSIRNWRENENFVSSSSSLLPYGVKRLISKPSPNYKSTSDQCYGVSKTRLQVFGIFPVEMRYGGLLTLSVISRISARRWANSGWSIRYHPSNGHTSVPFLPRSWKRGATFTSVGQVGLKSCIFSVISVWSIDVDLVKHILRWYSFWTQSESFEDKIKALRVKIESGWGVFPIIAFQHVCVDNVLGFGPHVAGFPKLQVS